LKIYSSDLTKAIEILRKKTMKWTKVISEKINQNWPPMEERVLVFLGGWDDVIIKRGKHIKDYTKKFNWTGSFHWMPLPKPPKP